MVNEQINHEVVDYAISGKSKQTSKQGKYRKDYYAKNKQKFLSANQTYRSKKPKPQKPRSAFLIHREQNFLRCVDKHHLIIPILRFLKTKFPTTKNWNKPNWWCSQTIFQLLAQGLNYFLLLNKDNSYKGVRIGCIDIDQKGWTKIPTKYWTCYITANNGKIKFLFLYKDNENLKTGKGYFNDEPILDFKVSGGIMGIGSHHPNGQPYQVKGAGSFFLKNNHIFNNPYEVLELLQQDFGIQYKTISQHFLTQKNLHQTLSKDYPPVSAQFKSELVNLSVKDPPWPTWKWDKGEMEYSLKIDTN